MVEIRLIEPWYNHFDEHRHEVGEVLEVDEATADALISTKFAEYANPPPEPEDIPASSLEDLG